MQLIPVLILASMLSCSPMLAHAQDGEAAGLDADARAMIAKKNFSVVVTAMYKYYNEHGSNYPHSLCQLVDCGYLQEMPVNPYTGKPVRQVRIGELPNAGELSLLLGRTRFLDSAGNVQSTQSEMFLLGYVDSQYSKRKGMLRMNWNQMIAGPEFALQLPAEINSSLRMAWGGISYPCYGYVGPYQVEFDSIEEVLLRDGYSLPIQVQQFCDD